jgi:hypothetical protein
MSSLGGFLQSLGARSVANNEYEFDTCPWCNGRKVMRFNVVKMVGVCYRCPRTVFFRDLAQLAGINSKDMKQYVEDFQADERGKAGFYDAMITGLLGEQRARPIIDISPIELPPGFRTLEDGQRSVNGRKALAYMVGRGFKADVLFNLGFGYCADGKYAGRVIIPFYEDQELVYWQARDYTGFHSEPSEKIKNPDADMSTHGKSDVLFNYDGVKSRNVVVITESWGSALAVGPAATALNGKSMSDVQMYKLLSMRADVYILLLDAGTAEEAWSIAARLNRDNKTAKIGTLNDGDPAEVGTHVLLNTVKAAQSYDAVEHIRAVANGQWGR